MSPDRPDRTAGAQDESSCVRVAELTLGRGVSCVGEYLHADDRASAAVLLHDRGRDLDDLRPLAGSLHACGFNVLSLDLPGHGLSTGDYDQHSREAILAASRFADPELDRGVAFVAEGQTCSHLLVTEPCGPIAMVLLRPQAPPPSTHDTSVWRVTPGLFIVDPDDGGSERAADLLAEQARARTLRFFLHGARGDRTEGRTAGDLHTDVWTVQTTSMTTRFLLEQRTYWKTRPAERRR